MGEHAVWTMLSGSDRDQHHTTVAKFIQHERDESRRKVTLIHQQGTQQAELLRQQQAQSAVPGPMHVRGPKTLKLGISKYRGVEEDSLLLWFVELDKATKARRIDDEQIKLTFAQIHLTGRAKTWALGLEMSDPYAFGSLDALKARLKQTFEPPRAEFKARPELLKLKQGKRDGHAYAQHIRLLAGSITANPGMNTR